jgi:hypothetical protein
MVRIKSRRQFTFPSPSTQFDFMSLSIVLALTVDRFFARSMKLILLWFLTYGIDRAERHTL